MGLLIIKLLCIFKVTVILLYNNYLYSNNSDYLDITEKSLLFATHRAIPTNYSVFYWIKHIRKQPTSIPIRPFGKSQHLTLLLISGIEQNPGPDSLKFPCGVCNCEVEDFGARAICCNTCDKWTHKSCIGMLTPEYNDLEANSSVPWYCPDCGTPHHSFILYDAPDSEGSIYSDVSEGEPSTPNISSHSADTHSFSNSSISSIGSPYATSSPKTCAKNAAKQKRSLRILNINFQSVRNKGRNIDVLVETTNPDIILGTETWLSEDIQSPYFFNPILGYTVYRRDRPKDPHGGVLIAVKNEIEVLDIHRHAELELISGTFKIGKKKAVIASFYRPPNLTDQFYLDMVKHEFQRLKAKFKQAIFLIGGDFNLPDINWNNHTVTNSQYPHRVSKTFLDITMDLNLEQMVKFPTRLQNTLDLLFMSHPSFKIRCKPLPPISLNSDHDIVLLDTAIQPIRSRQPRRRIYLWKKCDEEGIKNHISLFAEQFKEKNYTSIEEMWNSFKAAISSAVDKYVPSKMTSTRQTHPWVNTHIRRLMRRKQRAHRKAQKTGKDLHWRRYKSLQKEAQSSIRGAEKQYLQDVISGTLNTDPKRFFSYIKSRKQDQIGVSSLLDQNGYIQSDTTARANILNNQFQSAYTKENTNDIPDMGKSPHPSMPKITFSTPGIIKLLKNLNPYKAAGPDTIPTHILKIACNDIAPVLRKIFEHSYNTGILHRDWKDANIVPIFKKGDKQIASNYRPVSLTSISCKVMEHIIHSNVMKHFERNNILCDEQHGFRKQRSCESQLITTVQGIARKLHSGRNQVDIILLDFSKAFDKVPHQRLLHKLSYYGVRDENLMWVKSFLSGRKQRVVLDGKESTQAEVTSGVPQGTVNGPLYFLAFINDLPECTMSDTRLFADDGLLYREIKSDKDAKDLQKDLESLEKWEDKWQMKFHPEKCQVIHICTNERFRRQHKYTLHGHVLEAVDSAKYLGVHISKDMSWRTHVNQTAAKANKTLGFLRRNLYNCSREVRERSYNTFVLPTLNYASSVWDPYHAEDVDQLEKVQRRGARFVHNNYRDRTPGCVTKMIRDLEWLSLAKRRQINRLQYLFKIRNHVVDINPGDLLQAGDSRTRGSGRIRQHVTYSAVYHNSFYPRTIRDWNQLPTQVTDLDCLEDFAAALDDMVKSGSSIFQV